VSEPSTVRVYDRVDRAWKAVPVLERFGKHLCMTRSLRGDGFYILTHVGSGGAVVESESKARLRKIARQLSVLADWNWTATTEEEARKRADRMPKVVRDAVRLFSDNEIERTWL